MIRLDDPSIQLDDLLDKMAETLQLDDTRYDRMKTSYKAVHEYVLADPFFEHLVLETYSQGSVKTGTANKPYKGNEFDLDTVIQLKPDASRFGVTEIRNQLERRLREPSSRYKDMLESKSRCVRIKYAGDFHMDVLAAPQQSHFCKNTLLVLNKDKHGVDISNPRGHANWFIAKANSLVESLLEKADKIRSIEIERLPNDNFRRKKPLQRATQLLKRYRDIFFERDDTYQTSSVILTTIAGQYYQGEASIFDTMDGIITRIVHDADSLMKIHGGRIKVLNPVNSLEDFTSKWETEPEYYSAFLQFVRNLKNQWEQFKKQQGVLTESRVLKGLFGDELYTQATNASIDEINSRRSAGKLFQTPKTGILSGSFISGGTVKPNTFYGE
ncbi:nucleotidyltransferase domain-containing protein [Dyadobacter chenhuakuii]|uniref:Nucleotidyltransferase n=1 Tax=Dyadobacter chenhuakuii TaxID=2909339 RepID=A0A9X1TUI0_9BACT|nr:nucleotidyltransferase [Dyadobacter chenhuakuii]MCF2501354.1 nucleotidyltransferase [Dyadobacter chenhuakuii]